MSKTLIVLLAPMLLLAACASQPASQAKAGETQDSRCLEETGSRIEREGCAGHGRSVSREELERSGGQNTGDSLKRVVN